MLVEISNHRRVPIRAVLCLPAIAGKPDDRGKIWAEFYPVDLLLRLRATDRVLEGHPYYDLVQEEIDSGLPARMVEALTKTQAAKIQSNLNQGRMVAVGLVNGRPRRSGIRQQAPQFYFVTPDEAGLSEEDDKWLDAICESGAWLYQRKQEEAAAKAIGDFAQRLYRKAANGGKPNPKKKGKNRRSKSLV